MENSRNRSWHISASFMADFKACSERCHNRYVRGIVPDEDSDVLRMGTNWHRVLEINALHPGAECPECAGKQHNLECPLCQGTNVLPDDMTQAVLRFLNNAYANCPDGKDREAWETERAVLMNSLIAYNWLYQDDEGEVISTEIPFKIRVLEPGGMPVGDAWLVGKIDKLMRMPNGQIVVPEHKSTSSDLSPESRYWSHLKLDVQTTLYPYAARRLQKDGELEKFGIKSTDPLISDIMLDAWHKPMIRPKFLSQGDSKTFMGSGEYCGVAFGIEGDPIRVDSELAEIKPGAKDGTYAIRETIGMFGARLRFEISQEPYKYFTRRLLSRTDADIARVEQEIFSVLNTVKFLSRTNSWWKNEHACEATYKCPYLDLCYNNVDLDEGGVPSGFRSIFERRTSD